MVKSQRPRDAGAGFFNPFPRYLQIRNILIRRLNNGFSLGDRFPTEHELCGEFGVSRETVREALLGLQSDGLLVRHRGKGTFVARLPDIAQDERLTGLVEDFTELRLRTDAKVLKAVIERPPARIAAALHIDQANTLFRIVRLRRVEGKPFAYHDAFLPGDLGRKLARLNLTHTTLFRELRETLGVKLVEIYQHIDAAAADVSLAKTLEIDVGMPLLVIRRALSHDTSLPTMLFETYFRADRYYYSVQLQQGRGKAARPGPISLARLPAGHARSSGRRQK